MLDVKENFSRQGLFTAAWNELYPGMIEWVPGSKGGKIQRVDTKTLTVYTEEGMTSHKGDVVNIIPAQRAGEGGRYCRVDRSGRRGRLVPGESADLRVDHGAGYPCDRRFRRGGRHAQVWPYGEQHRQNDRGGDHLHFPGRQAARSLPRQHLLQPGWTRVLRAQEAGYAQGWYTGITSDSFG